jgi:hypothetical protein
MPSRPEVSATPVVRGQARIAQKTVWSSRSLRFPAQPPIEECQLEGQRPLQCYD